ncbi:phytoene/squalene synthase family protein [Corynebacterium sp.]|uniref:phytoene/squalene synthase family protein n=1 Tax=Corynebacterium sp. TaxID=1720 RepID=UPI003B3B9D38
MSESPNVDYLRSYDQMAVSAAHRVITTYSTSFSLATRLLRPTPRRDICNLYAMVRIADEIVDGTLEQAGGNHRDCWDCLERYEQAVLTAPQRRFHVDPVLHAYALSARRCGFKPDYVRAFFASMRRDLAQNSHDKSSFDAYVYGSAEVIGLLCLQAFLVDHPVTEDRRARLDTGARSLGAAFQKVNFLRDLHQDAAVLGRSYFPGIDVSALTDHDKDRLIADIRADLTQARAAIPFLPGAVRGGVLAATNLFSDLTDRIDAVPAIALMCTRLSVPIHVKAAIAAKAMVSSSRMRTK